MTVDDHTTIPLQQQLQTPSANAHAQSHDNQSGVTGPVVEGEAFVGEDESLRKTQHSLPQDQPFVMDAVMQLAHAASEQPPQETNVEDGATATTAATTTTTEPNQKKRRLSDSTSTADANAQEVAQKVVASQGKEGANGGGEGSTNNNSFQWSSGEQLEQFLNTVPGYNGDAGATMSSATPADVPRKEASTSENTHRDGAEQADQSHAVADASMASELDGAGETDVSLSADQQEAILLARNGRPLNTSKRAAQNRAAQRAFRARRDEYVRQVEDKAKHYDVLSAELESYKERHGHMARLIGALQEDAHSLRSVIKSSGGADAPPPSTELELLEQAYKASNERLEASATNSTSLSAPDGGNEHDQDKHNLNELSAVAAAAAASEAESSSAGVPAVAAATSDEGVKVD